MKKGGLTALVLLLVFWVILLFCDMKMENAGKSKMSKAGLTVVAAPEQSEPMEHEDFMKEEYVSAVPDGDNLALEGKIEASSFADVYVPKKVIDGKTAGFSYWEGAADTYPNLLSLELEQPSAIHAIRVCLCPQKIWGKRVQEFSVKISADGENYKELFPMQAYDFNPDRGNEVILNFDETEVKYVELEFNSNTGGAGGQVAELEVYGTYE